MIDKNTFEVEMVNPKDDSTFNDITTNLGQICSTELLETSIEDAINKKKTIVLKIDSVTSLMKEVEYQEKEAEETKMEATQIHSDIMLKVHELMDIQQHVKNNNLMLVEEAYVHKKLLSSKAKMLQLKVTSLLDKGDTSLELLDEMSRSLETRLASAIMKKKLAIKKKKQNEAVARATLAYEKNEMEKVEKESKKLKQEAVEICKLQELLIDHEHLVSVLYEEIFEKCQDVKLLKEELDLVVDIKSSYGVEDMTKSNKKVKVKRLFAKCIKKVKIKSKLYRNKMFAKSIKNVNNKSKRNGNQICSKSNKKLNLKRKRNERKIRAKTVKKLKIKCIRHRSHSCDKIIKNLKIKGKLNGSQVCDKSNKKLKIKGNIKNLKMKCKLHENQMCTKSIKKVNIKRKLYRNHLYPKTTNKAKILGNQQEGQVCAKSIKKVKIKGLPVAKKRGKLQITYAI